ncbi:MAG: hypothetical protein H3C34_25195 [Caldilineaceae bacterium]|nr:hypothetical protein [Caldilineaceae bacterium]
MGNQLAMVVQERKGVVETGEMTVPECRPDGSQGRLLPSGVYGRWSATDDMRHE